MRRSLSYAEAVRMFGGGESRLIAFLDRVAGTGLAGVGLDLLGARQEAVQLGNSLTRNLSDRLYGLDRLTRTERLRAAHTVIVLTAYFEALGEIIPDLRLDRLGVNDQISLATGERWEIGRRRLGEALVSVELPSPTVPHSYESALQTVKGFYSWLGQSVQEFVAGLAVWDELDETRRAQVERRLETTVPDLAITTYEELFRRLATDCPEFGIWVQLSDRQSTRADLRSGLADLERLLRSMTSGRSPGEWRAALARSYQAALHKPIIPGGEVQTGLRIPTLEAGYIDHRIRVAYVDTSARPGQESWWRDVPVLDDPSRFFAGYLTSQQAHETPLVVLGQPGSGKSVLTRILAARLPPADFLVVRVELRQAPTEPDLQTRIETAIRSATGEHISWPRLVESCDGALPVVLLDGFDELLQATGVSQTDFLMRVAGFQERESDQGRPVAVIVTSRTAVADRARIPQGSLAIRLEPFDDGQVIEWLKGWNTLNGDVLHARRLKPLSAEIVMAHRELAEQPLLLLMLALYDADNNALLNRSTEFDLTELYERLLGEFAGREVRKHAPDLSEADHQHAVEAELLRLAIVGFAMFNRRSQWVSEADLDADLQALLGEHERQQRAAGLRAPLSAAQIVVGRFFFVHETQVTRDEQALHTYEFLHATFGEFLVARLVVQVLTDMMAREGAVARSLVGAAVDDGLLHALLSFSGLTARAPIIGFLSDLLHRWDEGRRSALADMLVRLHAGALYARPGSAYDGYEPRRLTVPARHSAWSMNLVLLAAFVTPELRGHQLYPAASDYAIAWREEAMLWRSHLSGEEWAGFFDAIALQRLWIGQQRDIRIWRTSESHTAEPIDLCWTYNIPPGHPDRTGAFAWIGHTPGVMHTKANLTCGRSDDVMIHALQPFSAVFPTMGNAFIALTPERAVSATNVLLAALIAQYQPERQDAVYDDLAHVIHELFTSLEVDISEDLYLKTALEVLLSAIETGRASATSLTVFRNELPQLIFEDQQFSDFTQRITSLLDGKPPSDEPNL